MDPSSYIQLLNQDSNDNQSPDSSEIGCFPQNQSFLEEITSTNDIDPIKRVKLNNEESTSLYALEISFKK